MDMKIPPIICVNIWACLLIVACEVKTDTQVPAGTGELLSDSHKIIFYSDQTGNGDIYEMDTIGQNLKRLTFSDSTDGSPRWLPLAKQLVFSSRNQAQQGLFTLKTGTSSPAFLLSNPAFEEVPDWYIRTGERSMVYTQQDDEYTHLYLADGTGQPIRQLTQGPYRDKQPRFSPDGSQILFVSNRSGNQDIWIMTLADSSMMNLSQHPAMEGHPEWAPAGDKIVFYRYEEGQADLYIMDVNTHQAYNLTQSAENELIGRFSPDGKQLVYGGVIEGDWEIFILFINGTHKRRLTNRPGFDGDPLWVLK